MRVNQIDAASFVQTMYRSAAILFYAVWYFLYSLYLWVTIRDKYRRQQLRAIRLRISFEALGGMLVKLGQQLSLRMDILSKVYCDELEKLLDRSRPFPTEKAIAAIEANIRCPLREVFLEFNPEPIGVASIACVYQARLMSGDWVVVKVRRPGIDRIFATDFRALGWTVRFVEFLTMAKRGILANFQSEIRDVFTEELDFRIEARYQELFRRYLKRRKHLHVTAPRVHAKYTSREVMVSDYVSGVSVKEIKEAVVNQDKQRLHYYKELGISPRKVAKRLIHASYYTFYECPFFHGDPHPANIVVQPDNTVILLDFGACGVFSAKDRAWMWQMHQFYRRGDVAGMVQCVLGIMEPLPLMNVDQFKSDLTQAWWHGYYGIKSKRAQWWERTSFRLWLAMLALFRKYQLPLPLNLFRMIRATLLYDTVAAQLYPRINVFKEFQKYYDRATAAARERLIQSVVCQALTGPSNETSFIIEQALETGRDLLFYTQQWLRGPRFNFAIVPKKLYYAIDVFLDFLQTSSLTTVLLGVAGWIFLFRKENFANVHPFQWSTWPPGTTYLVVLIVILNSLYVFLYSRKILMRFREPDNYNTRRGT